VGIQKNREERIDYEQSCSHRFAEQGVSKMSNVFACFKWVVDEKDIRIEGTSVDMSRITWKISEYDLNAIEAASQIAQTVPEGRASGLILGDASLKPSLKEALARGLDTVYQIDSNGTPLDDHRVITKALAAAVKRDSDAALVICAEGSQDLFARQTAPRLAALLGWPVVTSVIAMSVEGQTLQATRRLEDCLEVVAVDLPAVVAVLPEINTPEFPKLKAIMAASKKPIQTIPLAELDIEIPAGMAAPADEGYVMNRRNVVIKEGSIEEKVAQFVDYLKKDGVL
jgi:electron transfer flavoprotein beta subunit